MEKKIEILDDGDVVKLAVPKSSGETVFGVKSESVRVKFDVEVAVCGLTERNVESPKVERRYVATSENGERFEVGRVVDARFETRRRVFSPGVYTLCVEKKDDAELVSGWRIAETSASRDVKKVGLVLCNYRLQNRLLAFDKSCETLKRFQDENEMQFEICRYAEPSDAKSFNYAAEINAKIQNAIDDECDIIIVCDVDSFLTEEFWESALAATDERVVVANGVDVSLMYYLMRGLNDSAKNASQKNVATAATRKTWKSLRFVESDKKVPYFDRLCNDALDNMSFEVGDVVAHSYHGLRKTWKTATETEREQYLNAGIPRANKVALEPAINDEIVNDVQDDNNDETAEANEATPKKRAKRKNKKEKRDEKEDENV